jgi:hypothetical protein
MINVRQIARSNGSSNNWSTLVQDTFKSANSTAEKTHNFGNKLLSSAPTTASRIADNSASAGVLPPACFI